MRNAGSKFGLNLVLDVQQDEYTTSLLADQAGFMVLIHDQETPPMVEELGFSIGPGTTTFAAFTKHKVIIMLKVITSGTDNFFFVTFVCDELRLRREIPLQLKIYQGTSKIAGEPENVVVHSNK